MAARELLDDALARAGTSAPVIRVTARMHAARVLTAFSKDEARRLFLNAIQQMKGLSLHDRERERIDREALMLAAATSPDVIPQLPPLSQRMMGHSEFQLYKILLDHGHVDAAFDLLMKFEPAEQFPYLAVPMVSRFVDDERKLALMRRAQRAWEESAGAAAREDRFPKHVCLELETLPLPEALPVARKLVANVLSRQDSPINASFGPDGAAAFTSDKQRRLFELLDPLRHLDSALADSLMEGHPELAAAAAIFPLGMRSVVEAWERRAAPQSAYGISYGVSGSEQDMPFMRAFDGSETGQFAAAFEAALKMLQEDALSNGALKECWPSTQALRNLFHALGKMLETDGAVYLEQVPDSDLRLYGQIELAAGLAGLPCYSGLRARSPMTAKA